MKNLLTNRTARVTAFVLCVVCLTLALVSVGPLAWLRDRNAGDGYAYYKDRVEELILENWVDPMADTICDVNHSPQADTDQWIRTGLGQIDGWTGHDPNLFFSVRGADGRLITASEVLGDYRARFTRTVCLPETVQVSETCGSEEAWDEALMRLEEQYDSVSVSEYGAAETDPYLLEAVCVNYEAGEAITVNGFIRAEMTPTGQVWTQLNRAAGLYSARPVYLVLLAAGTAVGLLSLVFLFRAAGCREDGPVLNAFDRKVPVDLLIPAGIVAGLIWLAAGLDGPDCEAVPGVFAPGPFLLLCLLLAAGLYCLLSAVRQGRAGAVRKDSLFLVRTGRACAGGLKKAGRGLEALANKLPLFWLAAVVFLGFAFLEGLTVIAIADGFFGGVILWFLLKAVEIAGVIRLVLSFRRLQEGGKALAAGDLDYQVPLDRLRGPFRAHGENLNRIRTGIRTAVEDQMKSERMKTELITNVSHDIKTPLTSIVSYVDLLKKQEMPTPEAREYLEVLDRQSARLKKLTEDLVEASKASTGNLTVELEPTDLNVLLGQTAGEYAERLKARELELVMTPSAVSPVILADGRLLWRVFDNLLSNIRKYAQPGTRVYLTCEADGDRATVLFRNISASPLNISADELMERFVRGDEARSTEGSGLGLAIARDLTGLQGGTFDLAIDGDLFKVRLAFPLAKEK